jgi:hypothetical protein
MSEKLKELKQLIHSHLESCDKILTPTICEMKDSKEGKSELEEKVLKRILERGITVGQAINEIEREYNSNMIND